MTFTKPADIERESMRIIDDELSRRGVTLSGETAAVIRRVIHTTADFDYLDTLRFTERAVSRGAAAMRDSVIVTDTNMARAGMSARALEKLGAQVRCFMAEDFIAQSAREQGTTRAVAAMDWALDHFPGAVLAVGNAPTALLRIAERIEQGARPALVIGVPVGFVNVEQSKERILDVCTRHDIPAIVALGRKGGSTVAAAICNALAYTAAGMLDPEARKL